MADREHKEWLKDQLEQKKHSGTAKIYHARKQEPSDEVGTYRKKRDEEENVRKERERKDL
ncbi:MAG: hypothetical protein Q7S01_04810 [bacterium]|nr:hypothetical protein [bacterium]